MDTQPGTHNWGILALEMHRRHHRNLSRKTMFELQNMVAMAFTYGSTPRREKMNAGEAKPEFTDDPKLHSQWKSSVTYRIILPTPPSKVRGGALSVCGRKGGDGVCMHAGHPNIVNSQTAQEERLWKAAVVVFGLCLLSSQMSSPQLILILISQSPGCRYLLRKGGLESQVTSPK